MEKEGKKILLIETATQMCSTAIGVDGEIVVSRLSDERNAHSSKLQVFIDEMLHEAGLAPGDLDAVCVSSGPGSYTGLRIGVSTAKGICYALGIPLLSVPTLQGMAALYYAKHPDYKGLVCPMIDARRMECYTMIVDSGLDTLRPVAADVIGEGVYDHLLAGRQVAFVGDGVGKCREVLAATLGEATFDAAFRPLAEGMATIAQKKLMAGQQEDVAYFEPFYLKDFVAKKSVVHGLR